MLFFQTTLIDQAVDHKNDSDPLQNSEARIKMSSKHFYLALGGILFTGSSLFFLTLTNKKSTRKPSKNDKKKKFVFALHGGAGVIAKTLDSKPYKAALQRIVTEVYTFASRPHPTITAVDVVEFAVNLLENEPLFNAGRGAVYTSAETVRMYESITIIIT